MKENNPMPITFLSTLPVWAIIVATCIFVYYKYRNTPQLELQIKQLESQVATQEKKITEARNQNDTRVRERVQEVYQDYEDYSDSEIDSEWDEFLESVRKRNNERVNSITGITNIDNSSLR